MAKNVIGMDLNIVANKIKGIEGTTVKLEIKRENEIINMTITRRTVKINSIKTEIINKDIGYIQILSFDSGSSSEFKEKLNELISKGVKSLIIDVRDNGGGIVTEATGIADLFLEKDRNIMIEIDKDENEGIIKSKVNPIIDSKINIIVLTNENTASASEIFTGALKDNNRAKIIGTKTYGKGVMQGLIPVSSGGALKITINEFFTPNREKINQKGIEPDIEIEDDLKTEEDEPLEKAIEELK